MRNLLRWGVALVGAAVLVLSGEQASLDWSYLFSSHQLEQQRQVYEVRSYVDKVRDIAEQARSIQNDIRSGYHQGG